MTERSRKTILTEHDHDQMTAFLKFWAASFIFFKISLNAAIDFQNIIVKHYQSDTYRHP